MAYAFTFATKAAYTAAKQSGGSIYNALIPSSSTGGTTNVSRSAVSFIAELGRAVVDSVNLCVPYKEGGFVGDILCYSSTHGYFWEKAAASWDSSALGQTYHDSTTWPSSFVRVGYCFHREGKHGLITEMGNGQGLAWNSNTSSLISGVYTSSSVPNGNRLNSWIAGCKEAAEARWGSSYYQYSWPFPRTTWNEMVSRIKAGTTGTWTIGNSSYTISRDTNGGYSCSMSVAAVNTFTSDPADYNYDFDRWYRENVEARIPGPAGTITSMLPISGLKHDGIHNTRVLYATGNSAAASRAVGYAVSAPDFGANKWWIPTLNELIRLCKVYPELNKYGAGFSTDYAYWSSDQYNASSAWRVYLNIGNVDCNTKTNGNQVRLVSAFEIS